MIQFEVYICEDTDVTVVARVLSGARTPVVQADVVSVTRKVFDVDAEPVVQVDSADLPISQVIFDTLQTDARWKRDGVGYNFRDTVPASVFSLGNRRYRVQYNFVLSGGVKGYLVGLVVTRDVYSS